MIGVRVIGIDKWLVLGFLLLRIGRCGSFQILASTAELTLDVLLLLLSSGLTPGMFIGMSSSSSNDKLLPKLSV